MKLDLILQFFCSSVPGVFLDSPADFTVDATEIDKNGNGKVRAVVSSPSGAKAELPIENHKDGTYSGSYMPLEQGKLPFHHIFRYCHFKHISFCFEHTSPDCKYV